MVDIVICMVACCLADQAALSEHISHFPQPHIPSKIFQIAKMDPISPAAGALTLLDTAVRTIRLIDNIRYKENEIVALRNDVTDLKLVLNVVKDGPVTPELASTAAVLERQVKQALDNIGNFIKRYAQSSASTLMRNRQKLRWVKPNDNESFATPIQATQDVWGEIRMNYYVN